MSAPLVPLGACPKIRRKHYAALMPQEMHYEVEF